MPDPTSFDPMTGFVAGGGALAVITVIMQRVDKVIDTFMDKRKRNGGHDDEHEARTSSRRMIVETHGTVHDLHEMQREEVHVLGDLAKTIERVDTSLRTELREIREQLAVIRARNTGG